MEYKATSPKPLSQELLTLPHQSFFSSKFKSPSLSYALSCVTNVDDVTFEVGFAPRSLHITYFLHRQLAQSELAMSAQSCGSTIFC